jgi:hypothetical protein
MPFVVVNLNELCNRLDVAMKFFNTKALLLAALSLFATQAKANMIVNGDFENVQIAPAAWAYFDLSSALGLGWKGTNLEIWNMSTPGAFSGNQHIELNAHLPDTSVVPGIWSLFQTFNTGVGETYYYSFAYRARDNDQESFTFTIGDFTKTLDDHVTTAWNTYSGSFVATATTSTIRFTSNTPGYKGNLIDSVSVISAPATALLLGAGLFGMMLRRRQK